ncbi:MAG: chorismate mutase [Actinomycetota bacterium]|nr:chorismate mutase [Actinomycetota bacterium]
MRLCAIRGATSVDRDDAADIIGATTALLEEMMSRNDISSGDLVSLIFTATPDLVSEFPAVAARRLGLAGVALMCAAEIPVPGSTPRCVRVLAHCYSRRSADELRHVYLGAAKQLRADLPE